MDEINESLADCDALKMVDHMVGGSTGRGLRSARSLHLSVTAAKPDEELAGGRHCSLNQEGAS
jgi:hypothetical protein